MWRYAKLLPVPADIAGRPTTEPGYTRLIRADNLAHALGMRRLWVKDDRDNPTHSFKDRVVAVDDERHPRQVVGLGLADREALDVEPARRQHPGNVG